MNGLIDVRVPFAPDGNLGAEYNRIMQSSTTPWTLLLDHDVVILHPNWYHVCQKAIEDHPAAGLFTCWASKIGSNTQLPDGRIPNHAPMQAHREYAKTIWETHEYNCTLLQETTKKVSGFFMLTSKAAWKKCGFKDGFFGVDWNYKDRVTRVGFEVYRIDGIYCFHLKDREPSWIEGLWTSADFDK